MKAYIAWISIVCAFSLYVLGVTKQQFTLFTKPLSWNEARSACIQNDMSLAEIAEDTDLLMVTRWIASSNNTAWMGLLRPNESYDPVWDKTCRPPISSVLSLVNLSVSGMCQALSYERTIVNLECDTPLPYICQQFIGECTFSKFLQKGCSHNIAISSEVTQNECRNQCMTEVLSGKQCWAAAHWDGYQKDDCRLFFDSDPNICYTHMIDFQQIVLFIKECYELVLNASLLVPPGIIAPEPLSSPCYIPKTAQTEKTPCNCSCFPKNISQSDIERYMSQLYLDLHLNKKELSRYKRKFYSVKDDRLTAQSVGYTGALFIVAFVFGIALMDCPRVVKCFKLRKT